MKLSIADIGSLYASRGGRMYSGEPVTQLEHALQTAWPHFEAVLHRASA